MKVYFVDIYYKNQVVDNLGKWFRTKKQAYKEFDKYMLRNRRSSKDYKIDFLYTDIKPEELT